MGLITMVITHDHILVNKCFVIAFRLHNNDTVYQVLSLQNYKEICLIMFIINMGFYNEEDCSVPECRSKE